MLAQPLEDGGLRRSSTRRDYAAEWKWDGIRVQVVGDEGGRAALHAAPATTSRRAFPDIVEALDFEARARRRAAGRCATARSAPVHRPAAAAQPQDRRRQACWRDYPAFVRALRHPGRRRARTCAPCPSPSGARGWRPSSPASAAPRIDLSPLHAVRRPGTSSPRCAQRRAAARRIEGLMLKRWDSAYVAGRPEGPVVQVEARPATARRGADVRPARPRQALTSTPTTPSASGARTRRAASWCRSARPISASPTRSCAGSTAGCATTPSSASARCARSTPRPGARGRLRGPAPLDPPQVRRRHALPAHQPHPLGQAGGRGRRGWRRWSG